MSLATAEAALAARRFAAALEAADAVDQETAEAPAAARIRGLALLQLRQPAAAEAALVVAIARHPGHAPLRGALATLRLVQGRPADALAEADRALALDPDLADALVARAQACAAAGQLAAGLADADRAAALAPGLASAQAVRGRMLRRAERNDEAIEALLAAVAAEPGHAPWRAMLGEALAEALRYGEAEAQWRAALALDPTDGRLHAQLAASLAEQGRLAEAEAEAREGLALAPQIPLAALTLASILLAGRGAGEALALVDGVLLRDPGNARAVALKGVALSALGRIVDAADHLAMARLVAVSRPLPPPGFARLEDFHAALVAGIDADATLTYEPAATTTRMGFQTRNLLRHDTPAFLALRGFILGAVERYVATARDHPWLAGFPRAVSVYAWATVLQSGGRQLAHIHPSAIVSGVYYVAVPGEIGDGGHDGWIEFGRPPDLFHPRADAPAWSLRPEEGLMVLFPSWLYHRTFPFDSGARRISIAFDVMAG